MQTTEQHRDPQWTPFKPWTTRLVGLHAPGERFDLEATLAAVATGLNEEVKVLEFLSPPNESEPDAAAIVVSGLSSPIVIGGVPPAPSHAVHPEFKEQCDGSQWLTMVDTMLNPDRCLEEYRRLAEVLFTVGDIVTVIDETTHCWYSAETLRDELLHETMPPCEALLWQTHILSTSEDLKGSTAWVYTSGLLRCGLPDLEMLEVPGEFAREAVRLLDACASLAVDLGMPKAQEPWTVGTDLSVCVIPWRKAIETLDPDSIGTIAHRESLSAEGQEEFLAERAVVCGAVPRGSFREIYTWPAEAIKCLADSEASLLQSTHASLRNQALAQRSWPEVADAFAKTSAEGVLIVGVPVGETPEGGTEVGWVQVDSCREDGGVGRLLKGSLAADVGATVSFDAGDLRGWRLSYEHGTISQLDNVDPLTFARCEA
jgi:hypothetical protein